MLKVFFETRDAPCDKCLNYGFLLRRAASTLISAVVILITPEFQCQEEEKGEISADLGRATRAEEKGSTVACDVQGERPTRFE